MVITASETKRSGGDSLARGTIALLAAQFAFLVGGYAVHFFLGRRLGPADYGTFGVVMAFLVWMEVSLTGGFPYAIRKFGAEMEESLPSIARAAMRGQFVYAALIMAIALIAAPWVAAAMRDPGLTGLIRLAALDIPIYAFYFCYTAVLNGRRDYTKQAASMVSYAAAKVAGILILVSLGFGVVGALIGNILASVVGLAVAAMVAGRLRKAPPYPIRNLINFAGSTAVLGIAFTLLISIDLFAVKAMLRSAEAVGYYAAANTLARAPFYLFLGIATATLPALSKAASRTDHELVSKYIGQSLRVHMMLLAPLTAIISGTAPIIINILYSERYAAAATSLAVLVVALMLFGFLHALYNILVATGDTRTPILGTTLLTATAIILNLLLLPRFGAIGAAIAAVVVAAAGLIFSGVICARRFGRMIAPIVALRIAAAAVVVYVGARWAANLEVGPAILYPALLSAYVALLAAMGEISREDIIKTTSAIGLRKSRTTANRRVEKEYYENSTT